MKKNQLRNIVLFLITAVTLAVSPMSFGLAGIDYNAKVAQVEFGITGLQEVKTLFGEPVKYEGDVNSDSYWLIYPDYFCIWMVSGAVKEVRFGFVNLGYACFNGIGIGSHLDKVIANVGYPNKTVYNEPNGYEDGVLYINIDGRRDEHYYERKDRHVRFYFRNNLVERLELTGQPVSDLELKLNKLRFQYELSSVESIFGPAQKYVWSDKEFTRDQLPVENYILIYDDSPYSIWMQWNAVKEFRLHGEAGYSCYDGIKYGSSLDEVLSKLGNPKEIVDGKACDYRDYVLYKNIDGTPGYCYYSRPDRHIRFFFSNFKVSALYLRDQPVPEINQKIGQYDFENSDREKVISVFGEPMKYTAYGQEYPKDNLPEFYCMEYPGDFMICVYQNRAYELRFHSNALGYKWPDSGTGAWGTIQVGASLQEVLWMVGEPTETVVGQACDGRDKVLYKDIDGQTGYCYYARSDRNVRFFFLDNKVNALYLTGYPIIPYADVRCRNLAEFDLSGKLDLVKSLFYNTKTTWPGKDKLPADVDPLKVLENGKNPGLGVRTLHKQGITGQGISVAIIDQNLERLDHPEFNGKLVEYYEVEDMPYQGSFHGPAVISLLAGKHCGTAPDVNIYYVAIPSWSDDAAYFAKALDWILEKNKSLTASKKIRVVSFSEFTDDEVKHPKNQDLWKAAMERAKAEGILLLDLKRKNGFVGSCYFNPGDPENVQSCKPGFPGFPLLYDPTHLLAPTAYHAYAEHSSNRLFEYCYDNEGGWSWAPPYVAGVLAMGWQIRPEMTGEQMKEL
ncbi:MAG: hypothetical protein EHM45_21555, partial [Desulfobacteraceae bacterium]